MDVMQTIDSSHPGIVENSPYRIVNDRHAKGSQLGNSWYFSRKEIEDYSLSRRDGIDLKKESYLRKSYCSYLQNLGTKLQVSHITIATAIVFCHRFFLRQSHAKNEWRTIATVCMFLAGKVEETPRTLKEVIVSSYKIIHKNDPVALQRIKQKPFEEEVYNQQKEPILLGERVLLVTLGFDLNVHHPYKPLVEAIKKLKITQKELVQVAWSFVNDGLCTSLCLQFKPHHIAAGAIFLAAKFLKVKLPSDGEKVSWEEFDVTPQQLEEISNQMLELYEQNPVAPPQLQGKDTEGSSVNIATQRAPRKALGTADKPLGQKSVSGRHGYDHPHPGKQNSNQTIPARGGSANSNACPNMTSSVIDARKKMDKDKVKATLEKRRSRSDASIKGYVMDDDDLIERELERGVELVPVDEKIKQDKMQSCPRSAHWGDQQNATIEGGELSMDSQQYLSPELDNRKKKDSEEQIYDRGERDVKRLRV